jgi:hypothetical protein
MDKVFSKRIQIFTEDKNRENLLEFISLYFEGFNFQTFKGFYKGKIEDSIKFDFWIEDSQLVNMNFIVDFIIHNNNQECVGIVDEKGQRFLSQGNIHRYFKGTEEDILKGIETHNKYYEALRQRRHKEEDSKP